MPEQAMCGRFVSGCPPSLQRQRKGRDLRAARIQLQPEEVVAQHGVRRLGRAHPLDFLPHRDQHVQGRDQEVAGSAARVHHRHARDLIRPGREGPCGGSSIVAVAQVGPGVPQMRFGIARGEPGAKRILEQEIDDVVFGEELGHRWQVVAGDLLASRVDFVLALRLPELVDPAQRVGGGEERRIHPAQNPRKILPVLGRQPQRHVETEEAGQARGRKRRRQLPRILVTLRRQFPNIVEGEGHAVLGMHEQPILGQEAGEKHPVPRIVGQFLDQKRLSGFDSWLIYQVSINPTESEIPCPATQCSPKCAVIFAQSIRRRRFGNIKTIKAFADRALGDLTCGKHCLFKLGSI